MREWYSEIAAFRRRKADAAAEAGQVAALRLMCGLDLEAALASRGARRAEIVRQVARLVERERLKGAHGHWSYDLNRHIALKQALDRLRPPRAAAPKQRKGGATGRRQEIDTRGHTREKRPGSRRNTG
ncbi:hypothetical protein N1F89_09010 [Aquibium sp. A9E412]|uniref:hypothetical protein n=1 Tax=Aquibium sp. A9E412 TaxID=2976767 RepID=UPI0025B0DFD8|nr:hypothetical protein [Aquibium sp. A9E412]MDN2566360.1 hypothetical protein [Aquibium sp. A9E412]